MDITPPLVPSARSFDSVMAQDIDQIRLLSIFHYIVGGLCFLCASIPLIHVGLGVMMVVAPDSFSGNSQPPPALLGYIIAGVAGACVLLGWAVAVCTIISGRQLAKRRKRMFSFIMACLLCLFMPFGTVLGVFTIIVLNRPSVQRLYEQVA